MDCAASVRKSANSYAAGPKSPIPNGPGSDVGCRRIPLDLGKLTVLIQEFPIYLRSGFSPIPADSAGRKGLRSFRAQEGKRQAGCVVLRHGSPTTTLYLQRACTHEGTQRQPSGTRSRPTCAVVDSTLLPGRCRPLC